ncbi:MAG: hypothetical protein OM95_15030 [Bdellovibrio sp. ArHS]|uniref:DUF4339 domain-containing protein n=1 Tax=Bdellovibrio sp. ArHS TaxID=1569284 RepID=UPI000582AB95|nr:DUF4339 domain-containing protein [Bdellovibrio sp. ArHS]KHD87329.1 MAG: hypothetical protein OM95_15030 [Bdellovibrio sp. ArHS]
MKNNSWYYNKNLKPQGPVSLQEMRALIHRGEVGPYDLVCCARDSVWKATCEFAEFERSLFPAVQVFVPGEEVAQDEREWVLLSPSETGKSLIQEGPFSVRELRDMLINKKIVGEQYIWKSGLSGWCRLQDRPEFSELV